MTQNFETGLMWFRRDLRLVDNAALHLALRQCARVHCVFVFDRDILAPLPRADRRVEFIRESLVELDAGLRQLKRKAGAGLIVVHAVARDEIPRLAAALRVQAVFAARDYEPQAQARDEAVRQALAQVGCAFFTCKDQVIFEGRDILTQSGTPYGVFTPYKNNWLKRVAPEDLAQHDSAPLAPRLLERPPEF
ncbi:MAG: deoxyribodipyrimidine photo-lyase, partial [Rhodoferax sp.]|uniref:deoxyribodipyrimidine photo-lyase n=1 Tax=Rhodoferax sp. TaxID=50421 RepID=UPI002736F86B